MTINWKAAGLEPLPYSPGHTCPDYDDLWSMLESTYNTLAHLRAHTAIAAMHDLSMIKDLPEQTIDYPIAA